MEGKQPFQHSWFMSIGNKCDKKKGGRKAALGFVF